METVAKCACLPNDGQTPFEGGKIRACSRLCELLSMFLKSTRMTWILDPDCARKLKPEKALCAPNSEAPNPTRAIPLQRRPLQVTLKRNKRDGLASFAWDSRQSRVGFVWFRSPSAHLEVRFLFWHLGWAPIVCETMALWSPFNKSWGAVSPTFGLQVGLLVTFSWSLKQKNVVCKKCLYGPTDCVHVSLR